MGRGRDGPLDTIRVEGDPVGDCDDPLRNGDPPTFRTDWTGGASDGTSLPVPGTRKGPLTCSRGVTGAVRSQVVSGHPPVYRRGVRWKRLWWTTPGPTGYCRTAPLQPRGRKRPHLLGSTSPVNRPHSVSDRLAKDIMTRQGKIQETDLPTPKITQPKTTTTKQTRTSTRGQW